MQQVGDIGRHGQDFLTHLPESGQGLVHVFRLFLEVLGQHEVVVLHDFTQLYFEGVMVVQISQAQAAAGHLVFIGRTNTAAGGADLVIAPGTLTSLVDTDMGGQDQRTGVADPQAIPHRHAVLLQLAHFLEQRVRRQHHAVADQALDMLAQDT